MRIGPGVPRMLAGKPDGGQYHILRRIIRKATIREQGRCRSVLRGAGLDAVSDPVAELRDAAGDGALEFGSADGLLQREAAIGADVLREGRGHGGDDGQRDAEQS